MQAFKFISKPLTFFAISLLIFGACKKEIIENKEYDNIIYQLNNEVVYQSASEKNKQKSSSQFISILYQDVFRTAILPDELYDLGQMSLACGDKQFINNLIVENYINRTDAIVPTDADMRNDIPSFVEETYILFYLRKPTEYEKYFWNKTISEDPLLTPRLIYQAFASSNEYMFY